jgi:hypothetical protein
VSELQLAQSVRCVCEHRGWLAEGGIELGTSENIHGNPPWSAPATM